MFSINKFPTPSWIRSKHYGLGPSVEVLGPRIQILRPCSIDWAWDLDTKFQVPILLRSALSSTGMVVLWLSDTVAWKHGGTVAGWWGVMPSKLKYELDLAWKWQK